MVVHTAKTPANSQSNPFRKATSEYAQVRPQYPQAVFQKLAVQLANEPQPLILEVGAGTGKMTQQLQTHFPQAHLIALEPAASMRQQLEQSCPNVEVIAQTLEEIDTSSRSGCFDVIICAQSFHWLDPKVAGEKFAQLLKPDGIVLIVNNQMRVELAWVKRLTRIMRSGDVHRRDKPPQLGAAFNTPQFECVQWKQELSVAQVMALARTRSAYLRADAVMRARMQANLRWYLEHYLLITANQVLRLPYETHIWSITRRGV